MNVYFKKEKCYSNGGSFASLMYLFVMIFLFDDCVENRGLLHKWNEKHPPQC